MTEMTIMRGRDIGVSIGGEMLYGVTKLNVRSRIERHEIMEYLSSDPVESVPVAENHRIELTVLSLFRGAIPTEEPFTLTVEDDGTAYDYAGCVAVQRERSIRGDKTVADVYIIESHHMTKRRINHAG